MRNKVWLALFLGVCASVLYAASPDMGKQWWLHPKFTPGVQTIGAGGTIAADACGGVKRLTSTAARVTDTTNTVDAPTSSNTGCDMLLVNVGGHVISLDTNALFISSAVVSYALGSSDTLRIVSANNLWLAAGGADN